MISDKLLTLYESKWDKLTKELNQIIDKSNDLNPTNPLLLKVNEDKYNKSDLKIMFFGQETNSWEGNFSGDISISINKYDRFFLNDSCFSYGGQFWNGISKLKNKFNDKFDNKKTYYNWNNICKIGNSERNTNTASQQIQNIEEIFLISLRMK